MVDAADRLAVNIHSCVNAAAREAAFAAITGPQDCVDHMKSAFQKRAELLHQGLNKLRNVIARKPAGAFCL